jgi:hypothetical protein
MIKHPESEIATPESGAVCTLWAQIRMRLEEYLQRISGYPKGFTIQEQNVANLACCRGARYSGHYNGEE